MSDLLSIYIHVPFCRTRCGYCDFNTYAGFDYLMAPYVNAVIEEISRTSKKVDGSYLGHTIYFGGGTPNLLSSQQLGRIIKSIRDRFVCVPDIEISTEANPGCLSDEYLKEIYDLGVNRLSLGMQSASETDLKILGRSHSFEDVEISVKNAGKAGFSNINLDLIFGIPHQSIKSFRETLETAVGLFPSHLSLYALSVEDGTPLAKQIENKLLPEPDEDLAADMYLMAMEYLKKSGFSQYEISNWAREGNNQCLHNLQYWRNLDYLGFGAGAHSHYRNTRWENPKTIPGYINLITEYPYKGDCVSPAGINKIILSTKDEISETMMMGMRLTEEGIGCEDFLRRFGIDLEQYYAHEISGLRARGLVEWIGEDGTRRLRLTQEGRLLGNQVFMEFIRI